MIISNITHYHINKLNMSWKHFILKSTTFHLMSQALKASGHTHVRLPTIWDGNRHRIFGNSISLTPKLTHGIHGTGIVAYIHLPLESSKCRYVDIPYISIHGSYGISNIIKTQVRHIQGPPPWYFVENPLVIIPWVTRRQVNAQAPCHSKWCSFVKAFTADTSFIRTCR